MQSVRYLSQCFGVSRFAYNWTLDLCFALYGAGNLIPTGYKLSNQWTVEKKDHQWAYDVAKDVSQSSVIRCGNVFRKWLNGKIGRPKYRKRGRNDSFYLSGKQYRLNGDGLYISKLKSSIRMAEPVRFPGRILSVTISRKADQYFASFQVELPDTYQYPHRSENQAVVGVDLGIKDFAFLSTGEKVTGPKALRSNDRKLKMLQRSLSRKQKGSRNRRKARLRVARQHLRIRNIRNDFLHKLSTDLVSRFGTIVIEDLAVSNMVKNHHLAKSISDQGWGEFRRQLEYKTKLAGQGLVIVDRFYPSSKFCSACGQKNEKLQLRDREWICNFCRTVHDRDVNAAINLAAVAVGYTETENACGGLQNPMNQEDIGGVISCA